MKLRRALVSRVCEHGTQEAWRGEERLRFEGGRLGPGGAHGARGEGGGLQDWSAVFALESVSRVRHLVRSKAQDSL